VDTVKQAEMFAAIREIYNIPRDENRKLRDYPTLAHVIRFVYDKRPDLAGAPSQPSAEAKPEVVAAAPVPAMPEKDDVKDRVLSLVVEKTGYPKEMLDLDLDLEADLGVDTVKQAEMFAAIREIYNIPRDENRKLRDYPTLAHVIRFVYDKSPDLAGAPAQASDEKKAEIAQVTAPPITATGEKDDVKERVLNLVVEKTGYPKEMLDLDLDLEADLGVDTVKQAEMFAAIREIYKIPRDENRKLRDYPTLAHVIRFVYENRPDLATSGSPAQPSGPPTVVPFPAPKVAAAESAIQDKVLEIVAEKTGYPKDMLDLELDLEADLGIDTVKQAEMFASVRAAYNIPRDENMKLRDFPTLAHVIRFAVERSKAVADVVTHSVAAPEQRPPSPVPIRPPLASFDAANRIPRRVPTPVLRPPLDLCKKTGINLGPGCRVVIMPDKRGVAIDLSARLKKLGVEVLLIQDAPVPDKLTAQLKQWMSAGPIHGVYWLPALDSEGSLRDMNLSSWHEAIWVRLKSLYHTMRTLYEQIGKPGTFLVSAARLGGQHGYDDAGAATPLGGAVTGFTKTFKRERTDALVKAVDFEREAKPEEIAEILISETEKDPGAVEIGYKTDLRWTIGLAERSAETGMPGLVFNKDSVFVVTGAAGSIVSAITSDLAAASGGTFYLLDLVPEPDPNNPDLKRFATDKEGLKRELFTRIQQRGERATPALVEKELAALERAQAAQTAIDAVRAAGGVARYFSVNLTDADGVAKVMEQVRKLSGHVDVLLHAAGMERSHFLPDKDAREFDLVFDVKADGWFNLLHAIGDMPPAATVAFSSIAGRFGNAGQTDYSSANDLLCKITSSFRNTRPATRGIVIDWTAWGGIGMATRGSIPKMMEAAGIDMLPPEAGVPIIRRELTLGDSRGEIVIAQRLGALLNEWDPTGGVEISSKKETPATHGPMVGRLVSMSLDQGLTIETVLNPKAQPFLHDHKIDGTPVLPGVMGVEAFAEAASYLLPGWHVEAIENVNFLAPFKFYRNEPRPVTIHALIYPQNDVLIADCRLTGSRTLPNQPEPQITTHFTARVRFSKQPRAMQAERMKLKPGGAVVNAADIYRLYFHGPAYQVVQQAWWDGNRMIGQFANDLPLNHDPSAGPTLLEPRLIELCFQTAGLMEMSNQGRMGLPMHIEQLHWFGAPQDSKELYAIVTSTSDREGFAADVVDASGQLSLRLMGYRTVALPGGVDATALKALQEAISPQAVAV
ncbi:MAG TPA: SDR family NAD(P)-dependent oxidoreductase, partial [Terriglobales bacterium]|nr:SDR family NAD(P)-dependent oxidoreductase [Terriglobales bacterium]